MIQLTDKYYLDSDSYAFLLKEKKVSKKKEETYYEIIAYCGNLTQVKEFLITKEVREDSELLNKIDKVIQLSKNIDNALYLVENGIEVY